MAATCLTLLPVTYWIRSIQCTPMSISEPPPEFFFCCRHAPGMSGYQQVSSALHETSWPILPWAMACFMA